MPRYDAVVVGAGVVGLSVGYHLARDGVRTLVVDRGPIGRASDAGAGILAIDLGPDEGDLEQRDPLRALVALAARHYPGLIARLVDETGGDAGFARCGLLRVAVSEPEAGDLDLAVRQLRQAPPRFDTLCRELDADDARAVFPLLDRVRGAIYCGSGGRIDGLALGMALRDAAEGWGATVRAGLVEALCLEPGRVRGVVIDGTAVAADRVVAAAGAWSRPLLESADVAIKVHPQRGQIAHLDLPDHDTADWPIVTTFRGNYIVPWPDRRISVGATREHRSGYASGNSVGGVLEILTEAIRVAPALAQASLREIRVGLRPVTPDGLPVLGAVDGIEGLFVATGHGPIGLQLGPFSGRLIADLIAGREPEIDLTPFAPTRFMRRAA